MKKCYEDVPLKEVVETNQTGLIKCAIIGTSAVLWLRPIELPSHGWVSLKERKPTQEDAGDSGIILCRYADGLLGNYTWNNLPHAITHFHPIARFVPDKLPRYGEWLTKQDGWAVSKTEEEWLEWHDARHAEYAALQKERE